MPDQPLTSPIITSATQYVLQSFNVDFEHQVVTLQIGLDDAAGTRIKTITVSDTFAAVGVAAGTAASLRTAMITYLTGKGHIN